MTADDIWESDTLMAINMKLGLPMWKFAEAVQAISAIEREECAKVCEAGVVQIGCNAHEAEGVVRRTRDAIAAAIRARNEK